MNARILLERVVIVACVGYLIVAGIGAATEGSEYMPVLCGLMAGWLATCSRLE